MEAEPLDPSYRSRWLGTGTCQSRSFWIQRKRVLLKTTCCPLRNQWKRTEMRCTPQLLTPHDVCTFWACVESVWDISLRQFNFHPDSPSSPWIFHPANTQSPTFTIAIWRAFQVPMIKNIWSVQSHQVQPTRSRLNIIINDRRSSFRYWLVL